MGIFPRTTTASEQPPLAFIPSASFSNRREKGVCANNYIELLSISAVGEGGVGWDTAKGRRAAILLTTVAV